ncbi:RNA polymerase II C-terminal domain phosphatase-like 3 isoform X1 [Arachis ipaensis]|uniref:ATP-dependent RNA helicase SUV3 DEXQ-box helicase domain-containing protein n=1 Tax=Arachis hypogaea TaxID=3818 RepID=A0A445AL08_ARAHY|nr:RNA polymerase II C-terminal domain phosphatase-like 3 isoform X1 [Arachis ipaensis]RYR27054.1 hypothetical protein Ahy_B02g061380 [Arachis hypogaea]
MSSNQSSSGSAGVKENASEVVIVDDDKEEGELEEGEIDDDGADPEASVTERVQSVAECGVVASDTDSTSHKLSVREVLEGVTVANVEESFEGTCSTHGAIRNDFTDLTSPHTWYPQARRKHRRIILHVGPTNSDKTHQALKQTIFLRICITALITCFNYQRNNKNEFDTIIHDCS